MGQGDANGGGEAPQKFDSDMVQKILESARIGTARAGFSVACLGPSMINFVWVE